MSNYRIVNGTAYHKETSETVVDILERCRLSQTRVLLDYGEVSTGVSWGELYDITGRVSRSTGEVKVPLLIHNSRSTGGGAILDHWIVGISESAGGRVLYRQKKTSE